MIVATMPDHGAFATILRDHGVPSDGVLIVHSAIGTLSRRGYRAEAIIDSLLGYLSDGTLLMPTMTWRTVTPGSPVFDERQTASHTGVLTEVFRVCYASHRSLHPTHSVAGVGRLAQTLLSTHHLGTTPVPATSPYGLMRDHPAYVLMLGVGLECATAIHHPEEVIAPDLYLRPVDETERYTLIDRHGHAFDYSLRRHRRLDRDFPKFGPLLAAAGQFREGAVSGTPWCLVRLSDLMALVFAQMVRCPRATMADESHRAMAS